VPRQGLSRAQVVDAAAKIADAEGLDSVTVARVASELGIKAPSLYNHVAGRDDLLAALGVRALRELTAALTQASMGRSRDDALQGIAAAYRGYVLEHPGLYAATIRAPEPEDRERLEAAEGVLAVVYAVLAGYGVEGDDAVHAARALRSGLHGFASIEAAGGFAIPADRDESFRRMVAALAAGLEAPPRSAGPPAPPGSTT
jgi:AcrR family transcriptional regulator